VTGLFIVQTLRSESAEVLQKRYPYTVLQLPYMTLLLLYMGELSIVYKSAESDPGLP
jgi:hypothetical protein